MSTTTLGHDSALFYEGTHTYPLTQQSHSFMQSMEKLPDLCSFLPRCFQLNLSPPPPQSSGQMNSGPIVSKVSSHPQSLLGLLSFTTVPPISLRVTLGPARCSSFCGCRGLLPPCRWLSGSCHLPEPQRVLALTPHLHWLPWPLPAWTLTLCAYHL